MNRTNKYNDDPVHYCTHCISLSVIRGTDSLPAYCEKCGSMDVASLDIAEWEDLYKAVYGEEYLNPPKKRSWEISKEKQIKLLENEKISRLFRGCE